MSNRHKRDASRTTAEDPVEVQLIKAELAWLSSQTRQPGTSYGGGDCGCEGPRPMRAAAFLADVASDGGAASWHGAPQPQAPEIDCGCTGQPLALRARGDFDDPGAPFPTEVLDADTVLAAQVGPPFCFSIADNRAGGIGHGCQDTSGWPANTVVAKPVVYWLNAYDAMLAVYDRYTDDTTGCEGNTCLGLSCDPKSDNIAFQVAKVLRSFMTRYELDGDQQWLDRFAEHAAEPLCRLAQPGFEGFVTPGFSDDLVSNASFDLADLAGVQNLIPNGNFWQNPLSGGFTVPYGPPLADPPDAAAIPEPAYCWPALNAAPGSSRALRMEWSFGPEGYNRPHLRWNAEALDPMHDHLVRVWSRTTCRAQSMYVVPALQLIPAPGVGLGGGTTWTESQVLYAGAPQSMRIYVGDDGTPLQDPFIDRAAVYFDSWGVFDLGPTEGNGDTNLRPQAWEEGSAGAEFFLRKYGNPIKFALVIEPGSALQQQLRNPPGAQFERYEPGREYLVNIGATADDTAFAEVVNLDTMQQETLLGPLSDGPVFTWVAPAQPELNLALRITAVNEQVVLTGIQFRLQAGYLLHDGMLAQSLALFVREVESAGLENQYIEVHTRARDWLENQFLLRWEPTWVDLGDGRGVYRFPFTGATDTPGSTLPYNQFLVAAEAISVMLDAGIVPNGVDAADHLAKMLGAFRAGLVLWVPELGFEGLFPQLSYYDWRYNGNQVPGDTHTLCSPEDAGHVGWDMSFAKTVWELDGSFTDVEMARVARNYMCRQWNGVEPMDAEGLLISGVFGTPPGAVRLARWDDRIRQVAEVSWSEVVEQVKIATEGNDIPNFRAGHALEAIAEIIKEKCRINPFSPFCP